MSAGCGLGAFALRRVIGEFAHMKHLRPDGPSPTLKEVGQLYLDHARGNWKDKSKAF